MDTSKMTDIQALAFDATKKYMDTMVKYNLPFIVRYCADEKMVAGASNFNDGRNSPRDTRADMLADMIKFIETICPGLRVAVLSEEAFDGLKNGKLEVREKEDWR